MRDSYGREHGVPCIKRVLGASGVVPQVTFV
jgi:hypothetical protein